MGDLLSNETLATLAKSFGELNAKRKKNKALKKKKSSQSKTGKLMEGPFKNQMMKGRKRKFAEQGQSSRASAKKKKRAAKKQMENDLKEKWIELQKLSEEIDDLEKTIKDFKAPHYHLPTKSVPFRIQRLLKYQGKMLGRKRRSRKNLRRSVERKG